MNDLEATDPAQYHLILSRMFRMIRAEMLMPRRPHAEVCIMPDWCNEVEAERAEENVKENYEQANP